MNELERLQHVNRIYWNMTNVQMRMLFTRIKINIKGNVYGNDRGR